MKTLRELFEEGYHEVNTMRHPSVDELHERLDEVLVAAGLGGIEHDKIIELDESNDGNITVRTSWMARQCASESEYKFPSYIIDDADPIHAAKVWGKEEKIKKAQAYLDQCSRRLEEANAALLKVMSEEL